MHEKTLLYSALIATAFAGTLGVLRENRIPKTHGSTTSITRLSMSESVAKSTTDAASAPISLTASDGSGIALVALNARAAIEGPLALTEIRLTFENPEDRVREGTFRITLPQGASLSRFAMKVNDVWQEGEVVEKQAARRAYEDFLHRRQDPALLEQAGGNEFSARVFPIPARGRKELVVTYAEVLTAGTPFAIPLKGLPALGALDVDVHSETSSFGMHKTQYAPPEDFVVAEKELPHVGGLRSGDLAVARVVPFAASRPDPIKSAVVLVDSSASRALGLREQTEQVRALLAKLGDAEVSLAAFDQEVLPIHHGSGASFGEGGAKKLLERGALGGSDLERALAWAGAEAKKLGAKRVILLSDGVATAGETDAQKLRAKVEALRASGVERLDAVAVGGIRDEALLRVIARGVLDKDGVVLDGKLDTATIARRLSEATTSGVPVVVAGAAWSWPSSLDGLQAGDAVAVFAKMDAKADGTGPLKVKVGQQEHTVELAKAERPLVERAVAQAEIQSLIEKPSKDPALTKKEIVALSTRHRVLSPHTALLVLETDSDYSRFGIDRTAKLDILTVDNGRVAVAHTARGESQKVGELQKNALGADKAKQEDVPLARAPQRGGAPSDESPPPPPGAAASAAPAEAAPVVDLASAAAAGAGVATGTGDLKVGGGGGAVQGGGRGPGLSGIGGASKPESGAGAEKKVEGPKGDAQFGGSTATVPVADADRVIAGLRARFRQCYTVGLNSDRSMAGRIVVEAKVAPNGEVESANAITNTGLSAAVASCITGVVRRAQFSAPGGAGSKLTIPVTFVKQTDGTRSPTPPPPRDPPPTSPPVPVSTATPPPPTPATTTAPETSKPKEAKPYEGQFKVVMDAIDRGDRDDGLLEALRWRSKASGDVLALVGLGEALEAKGDTLTAARAYGSIFELFSARADSRRFAGERLERIGTPFALDLAIDTYAKAVEERPDHPASHRLYAFALVKAGKYEKAFEAIVSGKKRTYPGGRFRGVERILQEDVGLIAAAWARAEPNRSQEIEKKREVAGGYAETGPSLRFVLVWETDANDVDFHIHDGKGGHAFYSQMRLPSGGELYADVTTGYGPECFTIRGPREERAYPYKLQAHYYSRGPMGYGMGKLQIIEHDGKGGLTFDERPFIVMIDRAFVDLGTVEASKR